MKKYDRKHYSQFSSIAKGLAKACEFGATPHKNVYQPSIDNCVKLWLGATKWGKVPKKVMAYYVNRRQAIAAIDFHKDKKSALKKFVRNTKKFARRPLGPGFFYTVQALDKTLKNLDK